MLQMFQTSVRSWAIFALVTRHDVILFARQALSVPSQQEMLLVSSLRAPVSTRDHNDRSLGALPSGRRPGSQMSATFRLSLHRSPRACARNHVSSVRVTDDAGSDLVARTPSCNESHFFLRRR